jgi:hypothetical protein
MTERSIAEQREAVIETLGQYMARTSDELCDGPDEKQECHILWPEQPSRWCFICFVTQVLDWHHRDVVDHLEKAGRRRATEPPALNEEVLCICGVINGVRDPHDRCPVHFPPAYRPLACGCVYVLNESCAAHKSDAVTGGGPA